MKIKILAFFALVFFSANAKAQSYQWITGGGSSEDMVYGYDYENVTGMCTDANGNVYITVIVGLPI